MSILSPAAVLGARLRADPEFASLSSAWRRPRCSLSLTAVLVVALAMCWVGPLWAIGPDEARRHDLASDTDEPSTPNPLMTASSPGHLRSVVANLELIPEQHLLRAISLTEIIDMASPAASLTFHLHADIQIQDVRVAGKSTPWRRTGGEVSVDLPNPLATGPMAVSWIYAGDPSNVASAKVVWDYIGKQGCYLKTSADYYPHLGLNQPASGDWQITAPASWTVVTQGRLVACEPASGARRVWHYVTDVSADGFSLVGGDYVESGREIAGVKYSVLLRPENQEKRQVYLELLIGVIDHYQSRLGRFPFSKMVLAEVEGEFPMGYGSQELLVMTGREFDKFRVDPGFVAHEAAHQWWGNWVMARFPAANWLNEGFATFCQLDFIATRFGEHAYAQALATTVDEYLDVAGTRFDAPITSRRLLRSPAYQSVVYNKGAMILIGLRRWLGPDRFWAWMRGYGERSARRIVGFDDFFADLATHEPDALTFVRPWLDRPGAPWLALRSVSWRAIASGGALVEATVDQRALDASAPLPLAIPIRIETLGGTVERVIRCQTATASFAIAVPAAPTRVRVDTLGEVLGQLDDRPGLPASAPAAMAASSGVVLIYGSSDPNPRVNSFMRLWANEFEHRGSFVVVSSDRDYAGDLSSATGLLLLGTAANNRCVASVTRDVPISAVPGVVGWRGQRFAGAGAALVAKFNLGSQQVVWFAPTDLLAWQRFQGELPRDGNLRVTLGQDVVFEGWLPGHERSAEVGGPFGGTPSVGCAGLRR